MMSGDPESLAGPPEAPAPAAAVRWRPLVGAALLALAGCAGAASFRRPNASSAGRADRVIGLAAAGYEYQPPCICLFDIDRTLTSKQGDVGKCPDSKVVSRVQDPAFGGGQFTLSALGQNVNRTFCGACWLGIVSMGNAGGPDERETLQKHLPGTERHKWSDQGNIASPLVYGCPDAEKGRCAEDIRKWYRQNGVPVEPRDVYFFDDHIGNTHSFGPYGFNARQVSCKTRDLDGSIGYCGATPEEVVQSEGVHDC